MKGDGFLLGWFMDCGLFGMRGFGWFGGICGGVGFFFDIGLETCFGVFNGDGCGDM